MLQLLLARLLEARHFATLRIHTRHDVPNRAIFSRSIHALQDQQHGVLAGGVQKLVQVLQFLRMLLQHILVLVL